MGQGALSKPVVQWWLSLNSSKVDRILLCECDHRADEPISIKAGNSGKFTTDIDRVSGREGQK